MEDDVIKDIWETHKDKLSKVGTIDDFRSAMSTPEDRKIVHEKFLSDVGDYEDLEGLFAVQPEPTKATPMDKLKTATNKGNQAIADNNAVVNKLNQPNNQGYSWGPPAKPTELTQPDYNITEEVISKPNNAYYNLDSAIEPFDKAEYEAQDSFLESSYNFAKAVVKGIVSGNIFGTARVEGDKNSEEERSRISAIKEAKRASYENIPDEAVQAITYDELYNDEAYFSTTKDEAIHKTNFKIKQHTDRLADIEDYRFNQLSGAEKDVALAIKRGESVPVENPSDGMNKWMNTYQAYSGQKYELDQYVNTYKDLITSTLNVIGEAKNEQISREELKNRVVNHLESVKTELPDLADKADQLLDAVNDPNTRILSGETRNLLASMIGNTIGKVIDSGSAFLKGVKANWYTDSVMNLARQDVENINLENASSLVETALLAPRSEYTGSISEQVVDKNGRRLVIDDGQVVDIRRTSDNSKIFFPSDEDIAIANSFDPKVDELRKDYRGKSIVGTTGQVMMDMVPMLMASAATGGTTAGVMLGSAIVSYGDYYKQALEKTGDMKKAALYAGIVSVGIGYVESKIGKIEQKLGRTLSGVERKGLYDSITKVAGDVAESGIEGYVKGPSIMSRVQKGIEKVAEVGNDVKGELAEEYSNFAVEAAGAALTGVRDDGLTKEEFEETTILTTLVSGFMGGANVLLNNSKDVDELIGYAALKKDKFNQIADQWVNAAPNQTEKEKRARDISAKRTAITEVEDTFNYIKENNFTDESKDKLTQLSLDKAKLMYKLSVSDSQKTKDNLQVEIDDLNKKIAGIQPEKVLVREEPKVKKTFVGKDIDGIKVFSDFDNTLYNPKTRELTPAGKELQDKLKSGEIKPEDVEILTARTADQAVPISKFFPGVKMTSDLSPEGKAAKVAESTKNTLFIDDNKDNLNAVRNTGNGEVIDSGTITPQVDNEVIKAQEESESQIANQEVVQEKEAFTKREQAPISEQTEDRPKKKVKQAMVRSINELKAEIELMKRGKKSPEKDAKIAEFEREIALQEKMGVAPDKGRLESVEELEQPVQKTAGQEVAVQGAPKGTHLNIGLLEGRTNTEMPIEDVLAKLPKGVKVISQTKVGGAEPTVSVEISRPLTDSEMSQFLADTKQQAIPQLSDGKGVLHDAKRGTKEGWGEFDPGEFVLQNGKKLGTYSSNKNDAPKTQGFFSNVVTGISAKYKPNKEWEPTISFTPGQSRFKRIYDQFKGKFDMHIATSIPTFRDTQIKVGNAISEMYKDGATMYDIGGSEGGFVKAITKYSKGKIKTFNLDPNPDMNAAHNKTPVKGSEIVPQAFYEGFEENGVSYPTHVPQKPVDVVHESMTFQFITPKRVQFVKEIKDKYLKPDGIFVTEEKLSTDPETYKANEKEKDKYKDQYYTKEQQSAKVDDVLVGMKDNQANVDEYRKVLEDEFKYVEQYWDAGNFKGFIASDSKQKVDEFISKVGKADKASPAAPNEPTKVFTPVKTEDAKLKKSKTRGEDGIHDIVVNGETIGSMYFNQGDKTWRDPDYKEKDVHDIFGNIVGFNKAEAIKEVVDRYNKKQENENKSKTKDGEKGQVGTAVGEKGSTQEEEKVAGEEDLNTDNPITEKEVETLLEPIGKNTKEREEQIYKFFALPAALGNKEKAREIAKVTNALWENIAKQLGKRSGLNASQWIKSRVAMLGKTTIEDALARGGKFQVIGEKGAATLDAAQEANTRLDNLAVAKEMEAAGKDHKTIKLATGWERGADSKFRYEIGDGKLIEGVDIKQEGLTLGDIYVNEELFKAYPELSKVNIGLLNLDPETNAGFDLSTNTIFLNKQKIDDNSLYFLRRQLLKTLEHEATHLVQQAEGFNRGGSTGEFIRAIRNGLSNNQGGVQEPNNGEQATTGFQRSFEDSISTGAFKADFEELKRLSGAELEFKINRLAFNMYNSLTGEVEARNIEDRMGRSPEQRRQSLLEETEDVAREDQIIIQNSFDGLENAIDNGTVKLQAENNQTLPEAATNVANNLLTELDRMIKEMSNMDNARKRNITTKEALEQKKALQAVRAELLNNMKDPKWQEDAKFRAAAIEVAKNQVIIAALDSPNESSFVHEMFHSFETDLTLEEKQTLIDEYNKTFGESATEYNTDVSETAARMWEKYLSNGRQVTDKEVSDPKRRGIIQEIFDKFTEYLQGIYNGVIEYTSKGKTREIKISPSVQALFDNIMGITPTAATTTEPGSGPPPAPVTTEKEALDNLKKAALDLFFGNTNVGIAFDPQNAGNLQADKFKAFVDSLVDYIKAKLDNGKYTRAMFNKDMADGKIGVVLEIDKAGVDYLFNKAKPVDPELDNRPTANVEEGDPRLDSDKHKVSGRFTNAGISEILEDFGSTGFGDPTSQSFVAAVNIANDMGYLSSGLESEGLIRDGILEGKGVSEYESVAIMHALMKLHKQMTETRDMINKNEGGNVNHLLAHQEELLAAYELFALAHNRVGTQAGRTLVYRKLAEAYKFDSVLVKERIRKEFSDLGDEQVKTLLDIVDKIEQKTKELQELNANIEEARNKATKQKAAEGVMSIKADKSKPKKDPVKSFKDFFSKNVTPPTVKFQGPSGGASPLDGYSEEEKMNVIKEFARHLVRQEGISSLTKLAERLIEEYDAIKNPGSPSLSVDDIYKALALSSNSEKKAKITEYQRNINKIKSTASRFNKIASLLNGAIPTTNTQKPKPDDLKKLDDLINDLKKIFIMEDFGYTPSESSEIVDDLQKVMDALQAIRMTDDMADVNAQAQELRKIIGRVNAQMKINKLQQKLDDIRAGILPDTRVSSVNTIIDAKAFKLKEDIDEARAELKNKIFEARAWQSIMDSPMGKFEFKGFGKDGRFGFRGAVLKYNLQSIRKNWYEYTRRYVLGGDIGTLMLQGGYPTLMMLGKAPLQVLSQNGRRNLSYNYDTIKDLWRTSFTSFFQEFIHDKDSGKPNPSVRMYEEMMHTDNGVFAKQMGLALNRPFAAQLSKSTDEFFVNKGLGDLKSDSSVGKDIISIFDKYEKISEGAYVTGVNSLRLNMFNSFRMMNPTATINELKQYAEFVNTQTGTVPSSSTSGTISKVLLAPRLYWSRIKLITMAPFALNDLRTPEKRLVAKEKLKSLVGFGIGYSMVMLMMSLFGYDHEEDPRDSDFLKFKNGAKTIDVSAGMGKFVSLLLSIPSFIDMSYNKGLAGDWIAGDHIDMQKLIRGEEGAINLKASKGADLLDKFNPMTDKPFTVLINRVGFSLHPTIRGVYSMVQGEDAISKPLGASLSKRIWNFTIMNSAPLSTQDLFLSSNTILKYETGDLRKEESLLKDFWSEMTPQILGINVNDAENNMKHLFVEDHLNRIGYDPKTTFTRKQIKNLIPELASTKEGDIDIDKISIMSSMRTEVYHSVGSLVLKNIQENNGIGTLSEDDIKDIFVTEGERIAEFYKDYYKDQLAVWRKEFEELERKEE